ncbi:MAG TPA: hypothetical protein VFI23_15640 [Rhizomicrobium sp.]|nr:hypothetical protein [Rhizomicrobium sp.]
MMRRISAIATIRDAYSFTFTHLGGIIGLIWVSMVMITIAQFFTFHRLYGDFIDFLAGNVNPAQLGPTLLMLLAYLVAALLLYAVMCVAVAQLALGSRPAPAFAHFAFGPLEWRMFRAFAAFTALMLLIGLSLETLANAAQPLIPAAGQQSGGRILALAMSGVGLVLAARFLLLLPAIAVNENAPAMRRAWALSAGHLLSLIGVLLGLFLPLALTFLAADVALEGKSAVAGGNQQEQMIAVMRHARDILPLSCGLSFFFSPLLVGLFCGASVSVWRALKDEPALDIAV